MAEKATNFDDSVVADDMQPCTSTPPEIASNTLTLPACLAWSVEEVGDWIESIGYPLYRACFTTNFVTGRRLISIDASALPKLGINDFQHVKEIARAIRELLGIELYSWNRSIALPPKGEKELFLEQKSTTGVATDKLTLETFHEDFEHIKFQPPLCNHALLLSDCHN